MGLFCRNCGAILRPQKKEDGSSIMGCSCGFTTTKSEKIVEKVSSDNSVDIVEKDEELLPKTAADCQKCKNQEAYYWLLQTRAGDEPETKFLKCTKCEHVWRDYS